jgi:hypothetical protein
MRGPAPSYLLSSTGACIRILWRRRQHDSSPTSPICMRLPRLERTAAPSRRRARCCALEGRSAAEVAYLGPGQPGIEHHGAWPEGVAGTLRRPCLKRQRGGLGQCRWAVLASITHKVQRALRFHLDAHRNASILARTGRRPDGDRAGGVAQGADEHHPLVVTDQRMPTERVDALGHTMAIEIGAMRAESKMNFADPAPSASGEPCAPQCLPPGAADLAPLGRCKLDDDAGMLVAKICQDGRKHLDAEKLGGRDPDGS